MTDIIYQVGHWMKEKAIELTFGGGSGILTTLLIDWNHLAERAVETIVLASLNAGIGTVIALIVAHFIKKSIKKYEDSH